MRTVQFVVAMFLVGVFAFSWCTSYVLAGAVPAVPPSAASSGQQFAEGGTARIEQKLDRSQPSPEHASSMLMFPSRTAILAVVCTGLGVAVTTAIVVSLRQPSANRKVPLRGIQPEFKVRTWVELTQSPQF